MANILQKKLSRNLILFLIFFGYFSPATAQFSASPANWRYPQGNLEGTRYVEFRSGRQFFDSLKIKWSTPLIAGNVQPLIGNIVSNDKIFGYMPYAPNEMAAIVGDRIVVIDGSGKTLINEQLPEQLYGVINISALLDTTYTGGDFPFASPTVVLGLETIEAQRTDSLAVAFIVGYDHQTQKIKIIRRFSINLKNSSNYPNVSASLKPVFSKKSGDDFILYGTFNMASPKIGNPFFFEPPYLRGFTQFTTSNIISNFPMPDIGDDLNNRVTVGPEVTFTQPSITSRILGKTLLALPNYPTPNLTDRPIPNNSILTGTTNANKPYLISLDLSGSFLVENFPTVDLSDIVKGTRPRIRPIFVNTIDNAMYSDSMFILVLEEYNGVNGSNGTSRIHLFDVNGNPLTSPNKITEPPYLPPSFVGGRNHYWSVAIGNVDGNTFNEWLPYFPNNRGKEIIVTQSSKEFAYAGSKLSVLRYNSGPEIDKPSPPGEYLFPFDTIASQRINGWVAAVNDFDGNINDGKDEIFLVNGSEVLVLRMKNYNSDDFRLGIPFDTVYTINFPNQTISNLAIADIDGDGLNDMIVTTFDSTYVIGSPLPKTISVAEPRFYNAPQKSYCPQDTVKLKWNNFSSTAQAMLLFAEVINNQVVKIDTLVSNIANNQPEIDYNFVVNEKVIGKVGFFLIAAASNPTVNFDTTTVLSFTKPFATITDVEKLVLISGSKTKIKGNSFCADTINFKISLDGNEWQNIGKFYVQENIFSGELDVPCLPIFNCSRNLSNNQLLLKLELQKGNYIDSSTILPLPVIPARFPISWDTSKTNNPTITFKWDNSTLPTALDSIYFLVSINGGQSFTEIDKIHVKSNHYVWNVPLNTSDTLIVRFCAAKHCYISDTTISNFQPRYIIAVSPNPMNIYQTMELVYKVPKETNVNVRIFDQSNRLVKEIVRNAYRKPNTAYCEFWDARTSDGSAVANGIYYIRVELDDGSFEIYPIYVRK